MALSFAWDSSENPSALMKLPPRKPATAENMERLRRRQREAPRSWYQKIVDNFKDPIEEETLVDGECLSWAYLENGTIETIGCFVCYLFAMWVQCDLTISEAVANGSTFATFEAPTIVLKSGKSLNDADQVICLATGQSAFYLALMIQQCFNLFICKARLTLPIGKFMFQNVKNFYGILGGATFVFMVVYVPPFNVAFGTSYRTTLLVVPIALGFGVLSLIYSIVRFLILRAGNPIKYTKDVQGLDLHPTRWSTGR